MNSSSALWPVSLVVALLIAGCAGQVNDQEGAGGSAALSNTGGCVCPANDPTHCTVAFDDNSLGFGNQAFDWQVPGTCTTVLLKVWGGGGRSTDVVTGDPIRHGKGGGGGYTSAVIPVQPQEHLTLHVAGPRDESRVWRYSPQEVLLVAGGGGDGGHVEAAGSSLSDAGAGGGEFGQDSSVSALSKLIGTVTYTWNARGGGGGSQTAGGVAGTGTASPSSAFVNPGTPGDGPSLYAGHPGSSTDGGYGGGGYGAGGGGSSGSNPCDGGGGGGSGYVAPELKALGGWVNIRGNFEKPANAGDPDGLRTTPCDLGQSGPNCQRAGQGGVHTKGQEHGVPGRIVIKWGIDELLPPDDTKPHAALSASSYSVASEATPTAIITVLRTGGVADAPFTVDYATSNGTGIAGTDYTATSGTLTFASGDKSKTFAVPIINNTIVDGTRTFNVTLSNPYNAVLDDPKQATVSIPDDDKGGTVAFSAATASVVEGNTSLTMTLTRTGTALARGVSVDYTTVNGTATGGSDYTSKTGTVTFGAGVTSATFTIDVLADTIAEGDETFTVVLSNPRGGATLGALTTSTVTIKDSYTLSPVVQLDKPVYTVSEGAGTVTVKVLRTGVLTGTVTVPYATSDGTAYAGSDYTAKSGTLSLGANVASASIVITVTKDTLVEPTETFHVTLGAPTGAVLGTTQRADVQITNDDVGGLLAFKAAAFAVTDKTTGVVNATITVTRTGGVASGVTVDYSTSDGTAVAGTDYTATSGTLSFAAAGTTATFLVPITPTTLAHPNRTINLTLSNPTGGASLGAISTAVLTITDPNAGGVIALSAASYKVAENVSTGLLTITVNRTGTSLASGVTVDFATTDGSALAGSDYTAKSGTLSFAAGAASTTFTVAVTNDPTAEGNETFHVTLSNPTGGATLGTVSTAVVTIDDDESSISLSSPTYSVTEGTATVTLTVVRTGSTAAATVAYLTSDGTALAGSDYAAKSGTLSFAAGVMTANLAVTITNDTVKEPTETFSVTLKTPTVGALGDNASAVVTITDND